MSLKKIIALFTFTLFCIFFVNAQGVLELLFRVIDEDTKSAIPYATVQFSESKNGFVANFDGDFRIPYEYKLQNENIIISSIGYERMELALVNMKNKSINIIELKPKIEQLDEVVIKSTNKEKSGIEISPYTIVKTAISRINKNYPQNSYSKLGYYRDYQIVNGTYYNLNEAIIESFDTGFDTDVIMDKGNQSVLYSYKENNNFPRDSLLLLPYDGEKKYISNTNISGQGGNELGILNIHNPIRNYNQLSFSFVYIFKKKFLDNHDLTNIKKVYLNDEVLYEIDFKAKEELTKTSHEAKGKIYISKSDFSIHKFKYAVYEIKTPEPLFEVNIEYKKKDDIMYLNYITFNNQFVINSQFSFDVKNIEYDVEENSFYVSFNNSLDKSTVDKRDFKFRYKKKKLLVKDFEIITDNTVKVKIAEFTAPKDIADSNDMVEFNTKIRNIYDIIGRKLYDVPKLKGFQYREFFVQEIFEDKKINQDNIFIDKYSPISEAKINNLKSTKSYWLNSPLKNIKK